MGLSSNNTRYRGRVALLVLAFAAMLGGILLSTQIA
jgi:hypothetical protein